MCYRTLVEYKGSGFLGIYMLGTQAGRGDAAYLARFLEKDLLDMKALDWDGKVSVS